MRPLSRLAPLAVIALFLFLPLPLFAAEGAAAGHWEGAIDIPGSPLDVSVDLSQMNGAWSGAISIPLQNAKDLPLTKISVTGSSVWFSIAGIPGNPTFTGSLSSDSQRITGKFTQGGQTFPFALERKQPPAAAATEALQGFDAFVHSTLAPWQVPGLAIAVVKDGKIAYTQGFGLRDVENDLPVTPDTLFPIGSATKAFTTFTLGTLVDEGKLDWSKPVRNYIPDFQMFDPVATLEMTPLDLVTHRSGLPRHDLVWYNNQDLTRAEIVHRLRYLKPSAEFRQRFQYNNLMFLTAGDLIERLTGKTWEEAVRARVLDPLGMTRTNFSDASSQQDPDFAKPYRTDEGKVVGIPFREVGNMGPAGSIDSSVDEMSHWMIAHLEKGKFDGKQVIQPATLDQIHTPQMFISALPTDADGAPTSYAMGWFVSSYRGHLTLAHGGNIDGFSALVTLYPFDDVGIVVLTNAEGTPLPGIITKHAADRLLALPHRDWNSEALVKKVQGEKVEKEAESKKATFRKNGTHPSHRLEEYAGDYENPGYGVIHVTLAGQTLTATYNGIATPLEHWHYDVFNGVKAADPVFREMKYQFRSDLDGDIASLAAPFEPSVDPIVFTKKPDARMSDAAYLGQFTGEYVLGPQTIRVSLQGSSLILDVSGQPPYELVPAVAGWFDLKGLTGFRARFESDPKSGEVSLVLAQPNGVFTAARK
ncbi:MAG: serine hydrolase [Thermoanaerobaculia bacterium]